MKIYNIIILDSSGSMYDVRKPSVDGVNETIQTIRAAQKEDPENQQNLSLFAFSSIYPEKIKTLIKFQSIQTVEELDYNAYNPCGGTPLYDAIGTITQAVKVLMDPEDKALVTIITDGYENASIQFTARSIKRLTTSLKKKGWIFAYIGANQDSVTESEKIGIGNALNFSADEAGTREMWEKEKRCRRKVYDALKDPSDLDSKIQTLNNNYFEE